MYVAASIAKHQPNPTVTTRTPASAGPKMRDVFTIALYSATALGRSSGWTISVTNDRRNGLSKASITPPAAAVT